MGTLGLVLLALAGGWAVLLPQDALLQQVQSAGVTYGLRPETFEEHPPDILVDSMPELAELLARGRAR